MEHVIDLRAGSDVDHARSAAASVRAAVARSREVRIRSIERRLNARLDQLRRVGGRAEHDALVAMLRRVTARAGRRARRAGRRR